MTVVRSNLMERPGYTPYCGSEKCTFRMPRTHFIKGQFQCSCGWRSGFEPDFIAKYEAKWANPAVSNSFDDWAEKEAAKQIGREALRAAGLPASPLTKATP